MERIDVDTVDSDARSGIHRQPLSEHLATSDVAINRYRVEPGERVTLANV